MARTGKKFTAAQAAVEDRLYTLDEAIPLVQKIKFTRFDETVEMALRLGVDPKHADQMARGTVVLPHGTGKSKRVAVIAGGEKVRGAISGRRKKPSRCTGHGSWKKWAPNPSQTSFALPKNWVSVLRRSDPPLDAMGA